jgi:cell division protein FtsB
MPKPYPVSVSAMLQHAATFLARVRGSFFHSLGTTALGFIIPLFVSALTIAVTLIVISRLRGREGVKQHLRENMTTAAIVSVIVLAFVYGSVFGADLIRDLFMDHVQLAVAKDAFIQTNLGYAREVDQLKRDNAALQHENTRLAGLAVPQELARTQQTLSNLLIEGKTLLDWCRAGLSDQCKSVKDKWERDVEAALRAYRSNPTLVARWIASVGQNQEGPAYVEVFNEQRMLDAIAPELR